MEILITGATGFIGRHLIPKLSEHQLTLVSRDTEHAQQLLGQDHQYISDLNVFHDFDKFDAVINLAGEPVVGKRWTPRQKKRICQSRWLLTQHLVDKINRSASPPALLISGSAIGVYGRQDQTPIDEDFTNFHHEFSHQLCAKWESLALAAQSAQTRVCLLRTGIVLGDDGALAKMLPPFRMGLGGPMASGDQGMSWIHIDDMVGGILYLLQEEDTRGIYNLTAPNPVSNRQFSAILAKTLHRPAWMPMPALMIKLMFGEMGDLFRFGQYVLPKRLLAAGYQFQYPNLDTALAELLGEPERYRE